jgi:RND family efflux transporter MFP subunit
LAKLSEKRVAELVRKNLESNQRLDEVRESTKAAVALVAEVQASIQRIEVESEKSLLRAPYKGYISRRMIDPGTVIGAGQGVFNLIRMDGLQGRFALPLSDASDLALGKAYPLFYANQRIVAELKSVSNERRFDTRTLDAVMSLPEQGNWLPGDLLHLHLTEQHQEEGAWLPLTALYSGRRGLWTVYILTPQEDDLFKISTKLVKVLYQTPEQAYVKGPLTEDDLVVVSGGHRLVAQQLVSLDQTAQVVR